MGSDFRGIYVELAFFARRTDMHRKRVPALQRAGHGTDKLLKALGTSGDGDWIVKNQPNFAAYVTQVHDRWINAVHVERGRDQHPYLSPRSRHRQRGIQSRNRHACRLVEQHEIRRDLQGRISETQDVRLERNVIQIGPPPRQDRMTGGLGRYEFIFVGIDALGLHFDQPDGIPALFEHIATDEQVAMPNRPLEDRHVGLGEPRRRGLYLGIGIRLRNQPPLRIHQLGQLSHLMTAVGKRGQKFIVRSGIVIGLVTDIVQFSRTLQRHRKASFRQSDWQHPNDPVRIRPPESGPFLGTE
jgi:hypothetical protein